MVAFGLLLNTVGFGFFCWLIFTMAVYALPFFVAVSAGILAFQSGAGILGAPIVAITAGGIALACVRLALALTSSAVLRAIIALVFSLPAALAGYHVVHAMAKIGTPSVVWQGVFACFGATFTGATAWTRLTLVVPFEPAAAVNGVKPL